MTQPVNKALAIRAHSEPEPHKQPELNTEPQTERNHRVAIASEARGANSPRE